MSFMRLQSPATVALTFQTRPSKRNRLKEFTKVFTISFRCYRLYSLEQNHKLLYCFGASVLRIFSYLVEVAAHLRSEGLK